MQQKLQEVKIIAHRGARSLAPENTLPAAVKAFEAGADGWELDVALSSDGVLVLIHDDTLERTTDARAVFPDRLPWSVYEFPLQDLQRLDFGTWFVEEDPFKQIKEGTVSQQDINTYRGLEITTLEEALLYTRENNWWVNIEIKDATGTTADSIIVVKVVELVEELGMQDMVIISSFKHDYLRQVKSLNPYIDLGVLVNGNEPDPVGLMQEIGAQAYHPSVKIVNAAHVSKLRQAGYDVNVWTVNDEAQMMVLIEMGVTGIFTDFPQTLGLIKNQ